ncbi:putative oxidoreductase C19A8.06 [Phytophthora cinnamomi]|uniref:putative oxidoreductase C19A8.06 n=1 Tax=Phytophthora cinnamomi TaxID=4785 RepID=UPI0035599FCA|nr:putative oxidoreductase C19A8.06 [Phytophthora cinnamomi]
MVAPPKHALVIGASSGIGLGVAKELAPIVAKLTLCSRSYPEELLKTIKADNPNVEVVHEKLDVSLMHEVRKFTTKHVETQFDWIVMSPGIFSMDGRTETAEGLDVKMATHYYGRFMLIHDLLGGLNRPGVRVLNVLGGGQGGNVDVDDLDLQRAYSPRSCAQATMQYSDLMAQAFSERAPNACFIHASPGFVSTGVANNAPWYVRLPFKGLASVFARTPEACAKHMVSALLNDNYATGWKLLDHNANELAKTQYQTEALKDAVWKHTLKTIDDILQQ